MYRLLGLFLVTSEKQGRQSVPRPFVVAEFELCRCDQIAQTDFLFLYNHTQSFLTLKRVTIWEEQ